MTVYRKYGRALDDALYKGSPRQKALLAANSRADRAVFGTSPLTRLERLKIRDSVNGGADSIRYNDIVDAEKRLTAHLGNVQTRYLQLREHCSTLRGLFMLFKQNQYFGDLLNDLLWGENAQKRKLREELLSHAHVCLGDVKCEVHSNSSFIHIAVADEARTTALGLIAVITDRAREMRAMIAAARDDMEAHAVHLDAFEQYLDGVEHEIADVICDTKCILYEYRAEGWEQLRSALIETGDDLLELVEALPDYESLTLADDDYEMHVALPSPRQD